MNVFIIIIIIIIGQRANTTAKLLDVTFRTALYHEQQRFFLWLDCLVFITFFQHASQLQCFLVSEASRYATRVTDPTRYTRPTSSPLCWRHVKQACIHTRRMAQRSKLLTYDIKVKASKQYARTRRNWSTQSARPNSTHQWNQQVTGRAKHGKVLLRNIRWSLKSQRLRSSSAASFNFLSLPPRRLCDLSRLFRFVCAEYLKKIVSGFQWNLGQ